ncbi:uncharacterized protein LOC141633619 [Silene latifolia]|uniref:uncharacterized protein LOC141633619 n=1 Tax=Silene latifolia TaxID=37657 RepID=UPI003D76A5DD
MSNTLAQSNMHNLLFCTQVISQHVQFAWEVQIIRDGHPGDCFAFLYQRLVEGHSSFWCWFPQAENMVVPDLDLFLLIHYRFSSIGFFRRSKAWKGVMRHTIRSNENQFFRVE